MNGFSRSLTGLFVCLGAILATLVAVRTVVAQDKAVPSWSVDEKDALSPANVSSAELTSPSSFEDFRTNPEGASTQFLGTLDSILETLAADKNTAKTLENAKLNSKSASSLTQSEILSSSQDGGAVVAPAGIPPSDVEFITTPGCSFSKKYNPTTGASFVPITLCGSSETRMTGVSVSGQAVGNYRRGTTTPPQYRAFKVDVQSNGALANWLVVAADTAGGIVYGSTWARGISENNNVIVGSGCPTGYCSCPSTNYDQCRLHALRWATASSKPSLLNDIGGQPTASSLIQMEASAINANASVAVGAVKRLEGSPPFERSRALRWTNVNAGTGGTRWELSMPLNAQGNEACQAAPNYCGASARAVSSDGKVVAGFFLETAAGSAARYPSYAFRSYLASLTSVSRALRLARIASLAIPFTNERSSAVAYGVSPDGWAVVGKDSTGLTTLSAPEYRPEYLLGGIPPLNLFSVLQGDWDAGRRATDYGDPVFVGNQLVQEEGALRWRLNGVTGLNMSTIDLGDLADQNVDPAYGRVRNWYDSRSFDASYGGCRVVGASYGGAPVGGRPYSYANSETEYRTAFVRPALTGNSTAMKNLKDEVNQLLGSQSIDLGNAGGAKWHLIEATAVSPDGTKIVGSAVCQGKLTADGIQDPTIYGFAIQVPSCQVPYQSPVNR